jgi:hypothetical protein
MKEYWCVVCESCNAAIPLLEYDSQKQLQHPHDFQAVCLRCKSESAFDETELERRHIEVVAAFVPAEAFRNISR